MNPLSSYWQHILASLRIAFQPIVNIHTGRCFGVEALLRGVEALQFDSIEALFDAAYNDGILYTFDIALREKVMQHFVKIAAYEHLKLFINLDNRIIESADYSSGNTARLCKQYRINPHAICIELSERHEIVNIKQLKTLISHYSNAQFQIAIDDFGTGFSGYKLLYQSTPDIIKVDRYFISKICSDRKKKLIVQNMVQQAILLGVRVVAEGVEHESELLMCRDIGFNWVQGFFVQHPTTDTAAILHTYENISRIQKKDKRFKSLRPLLKKHLQKLEPVNHKSDMHQILERFSNENTLSLPVVDDELTPLGIVLERDLKKLVYSPYGHSLLNNKSSTKGNLKKYIQHCAIADVHSNIDTIIELFSIHSDFDGILFTKNFKYHGYLSARALIEMIHERNLASARDQNPLTRLPGNHRIEEYVGSIVENTHNAVLCYFDFNSFKPYNDHYGFRNGDRVIQLFADILNKTLTSGYFRGHIGGDDFFIGISQPESYEIVHTDIFNVITQFADEVKGFYTQEDRLSQKMRAKDRDGVERYFNLLSVSAVVVCVPTTSTQRQADILERTFSQHKKKAKALQPSCVELSLL